MAGGDSPRPAATIAFDPFAGPQIQVAVASTEPQREIWTATRLGPEASLAFNESISLEMRGPLDLAALRGSLGELVDRHQSLRATFTADGLTLCVLEGASLPVELVDISTLAEEAQARAEREALAREVETPFDLETGPLARVVVLRRAVDHHLVVFTGHHIVVDGWSWAVLVADWAKLYSARLLGRAAELPPVDRWSEYAKEESAGQRSAELKADEEYWLKQFAGEIPVVDLPADRARPAVKSFAARREDVSLDPALVRALKQAGAREGASFFTTLLACFAALVHRLTAQEDVVVGIPAAGQAVSGRKSLVGHCVNTLPLRIPVRPQAPFRALLQGLRGTMLDAYEHQRHTFGSLLRKLPLPRDPSRQPLVSIVFNLDQSLSPEALAFEGLEVRFRSNPRHFETFDLFVNAVESPEGLVLECQYNTDLFDRETVLRWISGYEVLARAVAEKPATPVATLPVLTPGERERLLVDWNRTAADDQPGDSIPAIFREQALLRPDAAALLLGSEQMSYRELERRSNQLAHRLRALGVSRDLPVGLCLERSFEVVVALLGILKAGGAYLPLEHNYPKQRLAFMLADAGVDLVVTQASLAGVLPEWGGRLLLLDQEHEALAQESPDPEASETGAPGLAYVTYTSGSTGRPKGVLIPQRAVVRLVRGVDYVRLGPDATLLHCANVAFDASTFEIWGALLNGGRCALHPETVPTGTGLAATIRGSGVTTAFLTTALFNSLVDEDPEIFRGLRQLYVGGEALSVPHVRRFLEARPEVELFNAYGPTEATTFATVWRLQGPLGPEVRSLPIGRPIRDTRLYVLDAQGQPVPVGVVGELHIGGERLARGYLKRPELTAERFIPDPFVTGALVYRTGDLVRYLPSGAVDFVGRGDNQVKIRGFRIELGEIEAALASHPGVAQAAVLARQDRPGEKVLVAYVVGQGEAPASDEELREHLRRSLPKFMIPQHVVRLERMPLNASGKLDRHALPAPSSPAEGGQEYAPPRTPTEVMLAGLWEKALSLRRVSLHDDFFALGGHSLLAAQVLSRLNRDHGIVLPFRTIFEAPTIARFAAVIDGLSAEERARALPPVVRRSDPAPAPVSLMQERILLLEELDPDRRLVHNVPSAFRLEGPLDAGALARALNDVVRRHESLRTTFRKQAGSYRQIVAPQLELALESRDLRQLAPEERAPAVKALLHEQTRLPFDLEHGPLLRAFLLRLQDEEHVLFTLRHNAIWDGWSFDIFRHELAALYEQHRSGGPASLPEPVVGYGDFAVWHREWLASEDARRQLGYWRERLSGAPAPLELPTDRPRPVVRSYGGGDEWTQIPRAEADALFDLGRSLGATTFMVLLAAFAALLHRWSRQDDLLIASPVRNRPRPETEDVIGLFTNTLMLRTRVDSTEPFAELVKRVRATTLDAFSHQELPFDLLAREAPPVRVVFSLQEARHRETSLGAARLTLPHVLPPAAAVDMNFWLVEMKDGLTGALNYSTDLFDAETMRSFLAQYRALLAAVAADPGLPVGRIPLAARQEPRPGVSVEPLTAPEGAAASVWEALLVQVTRTPEAPALRVDGSPSLSFAELQRESEARAAWLHGRGVAAGDRVGLGCAAGEYRLASLLAIQRLGAVPVPLHPHEPPPRLLAKLTAAEAAWYWGGAELAPPGAIRVLPPLTTPAPESPAPALPEANGRPAWVETPATATGALSAVPVSFRASLMRAAGAGERLGLGPGFVLATFADASPFVSLVTLLSGACLGVADEDLAEEGPALATWLQRVGANGLVAPAASWRRLLASGWAPEPGFVAVSTESLAASQSAGLLERRVRLFVAWNSDLAGDWYCLAPIESAGESPLGAPLPGVAFEVLEPSLEPAPEAVPGMLQLRLAGEAAPVPTGERARRRAGGIERLGRSDTRVQLRGRWVELAEVRTRLLEHPAVADAAAVLQSDPRGDARLVAYVVAKPQQTATDTELRRQLKGGLPAEAIPTHFVRVPSLAWRADGTLETRGLVAATGRDAARPPGTPQEQLMVELWQSALALPRVEVSDNFFDLGGHSLLCLELVSEIERRTGARLKPRVFLLGTLEQVAAELSRAWPAQS